jgi:transposase-like protein
MSNGGRPRSELTTKDKRELEKLVERSTTAESKLEEARTKLATRAKDALDSGASLRALSEVLKLPRSSVFRFIRENSR